MLKKVIAFLVVMLLSIASFAQDNGNRFHEVWADNEGNLIAGWTITPHSFDFDNDGWGEFCAYDEVATEPLGLIFEADGNDSYHFVTVLPYGGGSLAVTDWDKDGKKEVTIVDDELLIYEWTGEDDGYPNNPTATWDGIPKAGIFGRTSQGAPAIFDADGDGELEIVCNYAQHAYHVPMNSGYYLSIFSFNGDFNSPDGKIEFTDDFNIESCGFSWGDIDNDGRLDIVTAVNQNPQLRVFTSTGPDAYQLKYEWKKQEGTLLGMAETYTPMVVDFDQDGVDEIYYCDTHGLVYVITGDLSQPITANNFHYLGRFPAIRSGRTIADMRSTNPGGSLGDQDGDGKPDLYWCAYNAMAVYDLEYEAGSILDSTSYNWYRIWQAPDDAPFPSTMLCLGDDMDKDNKREIVLIQRPNRQDPPGILIIESESEITAVEQAPKNNIISDYHLYQNYPNPFNPTTEISYELGKSGNVRLEVYSILGQYIATLVNEYQIAGEHKIKFNAANLPANLYVYRLSVGDFVEQKKMILLK